MSSLPVIEVFLRADPLEAVVISDPPVEVNQPIFQTINAGNFATAAQGELAESAVQPDVLALALQGKEDADPTILKAVDIGDSIQPYNANTVIDSEYSTVKSKAQSALQPENNISLLTNNIGFITENIPDGARIGGVAHFCRPPVNNTGPTQRVDGSALVARDRWWNTSNGTEWFWNGTYWLSTQLYSIGSTVGASSTGTLVATGSYLTRSFLDLPATVSIPPFDKQFFLTEWVAEFRVAGTIHSSSNYFDVELQIMRAGTFYSVTGGLLNTKDIGGGGLAKRVVLNAYFGGQDQYGVNTIQRLWLQGFGTAPGFRIFSTVYYRLVT